MIDQDFIAAKMTRNAWWCQGHGAVVDSPYLGGGMLYYALVHMLRSRVCLVLGSGGGFVPRVMRQAQLDLAIPDSITILVDANMPSSGFGQPDWLAPDSFFRTRFPDILIELITTEQAAAKCRANSLCIDFLHIDADHNRAWQDFLLFKDLVAPQGIITIHDTITIRNPIEAVTQIRTLPGWGVVNFHIGAGIALAKRS